MPLRTFVALALVLQSVPSISRAGEPESIVVLPLRATKVPPDTVDLLNQLLPVSMSEFGSYKVITKDDIEAQIGLDNLKDALGCDDVRCAAELAGPLGARYLLSGKANKAGEKLLITVTLIDAQKSEAVGRANVMVVWQEDLFIQAVEYVVKKILGLNPPPLQTAQPQQQPQQQYQQPAQPQRKPERPLPLANPQRLGQVQDELHEILDTPGPKKDKMQKIVALRNEIIDLELAARLPQPSTYDALRMRSIGFTGDVSVCFVLGLVDDDGYGTTQDKVSARWNYMRACNSGVAVACDLYMSAGIEEAAAAEKVDDESPLAKTCIRGAVLSTKNKRLDAPCGLYAELADIDDLEGNKIMGLFIAAGASLVVSGVGVLYYRSWSAEREALEAQGKDPLEEQSGTELIMGITGMVVGAVAALTLSSFGFVSMYKRGQHRDSAKRGLGADPASLSIVPLVGDGETGWAFQGLGIVGEF